MNRLLGIISLLVSYAWFLCVGLSAQIPEPPQFGPNSEVNKAMADQFLEEQ